jgi:hypothetical protein
MKFASAPDRDDPWGPTTQREEGARTDNPHCPRGTGGQARALGEENGEGTSGFVELGPRTQ